MASRLEMDRLFAEHRSPWDGSETLDHLQAPIQLEIARSYRRFKRAEGSNDRDSIIDDECERIEELLGLAFGATQSYITTFRTRIATLSNACKEDFGRRLSFSNCRLRAASFRLRRLSQ